MPTEFTAATDELEQAAVTALNSLQAATFAIIAKKDGDSLDASGVAYSLLVESGGGIQAYGVINYDSGAGDLLSLATNLGGTSGVITLAPSDGWCLIAFTRPAGAAQTVRAHKYVYGTNTWTHTNDGTLGNPSPLSSPVVHVGSLNGAATMDGHVEAAGVWTRVLTDAEIETLAHNWQSWVASNPNWYVLLDQSATTQSVPNLAPTNRDVLTRTGTAVSAQKSPIATLGAPVVYTNGYSAAGGGGSSIAAISAYHHLVGGMR